MGKYDNRIILLADQPYEAMFVAPFANELLKLNGSIDFSLAFTDYYTFLSRQDFLRGVEASFPGNVRHLGDIYRSWQELSGEPEVDFDFLNNWEQNNCFERSLDEIEKTNQLVYADERSQWHFSISDLWKKKILQDTIIWCEEYLVNFRPTAIVSVGNATLATNVLYTLAKKKGIGFYTFFPSRIGNRIQLREDFAYGVSDKVYDEAIYLSKNSIIRDLAVRLAAEITAKKSGAYDSWQSKISNNFSVNANRATQYFLSDLRAFLGRVYARTFIYRKLYAFPINRINENFLKMSFYDLRRVVLQYLHLLGLLNYGTKDIPKEKYFLWALHMRPEGAISTLGDGRDEVAELLRCAGEIPDGYFIAVKENPEMYAQRRSGFHRELRKNPKIILIDPHSPVFPLIESSLGVIGISGTILLEAAILNKPSCALGHPEFNRFLTCFGWDSSRNFIDQCIAGEAIGALEKIIPYLCYLLENTNDRDTPPWHDWLGEFNADEIKATHKRLAKKLGEKLQLLS